MYRLILLLALTTISACASMEAPSCRGEVFDINPTRTVAAPADPVPAPAASAPAPVVTPGRGGQS